ncbi:MAG: hypothetical protein BWY63_01284 [Chloroflexi bacterium ADurb.Bin360]|nr:MAG: hypothetical protein BWY63_01284 [Chloroflexi bacterium ADurb.Bin360]
MGDAGDQLAARFQKMRDFVPLRLQCGEGAFQILSHRIEVVLQHRHFVFALHLHARSIIPGAESRCSLGEAFQAPGGFARHPKREQRRWG